MEQDTRTEEQIAITNMVLNNLINRLDTEMSKLLPESDFMFSRDLLESKRKEYQSYLTT